MSASALSEGLLEGLGDTLRRELETARARLSELVARRTQLQSELDAALEAERTSREALGALEAVAREAAAAMPDVLPDRQGEPIPDVRALAGSELREMAARVALRRGALQRATHWREWLEWLREEGYVPAGKKPDATFLTQLARSPMVRRTTQDGVYTLDPSTVAGYRDHLLALHGQLADVPPPEQLAMLGDARERRRDLHKEIARVERAIEESYRTLAAEQPPGWPDRSASHGAAYIEGWLRPASTPAQQKLAS